MTAPHEQVDFVTESLKKPRGGKRDNAGRKSVRGETKVIRVPVAKIAEIEAIISGDFVTESKQSDLELLQAEATKTFDKLKLEISKLKELNKTYSKRNIELYNQAQEAIKSLNIYKGVDAKQDFYKAELQKELDKYKAANSKLVEQRDNEHNQVISQQAEIRTLKTEPARLKAELSKVKRELSKQQTRFCQCLTASGHQCTKPATHENKHNGFILLTCEQHYQKVLT